MKKFFFALLFCWMAGAAAADEANWLTSAPVAANWAAAGHKLMLLDFTGSDWCGWCMKLDAETFSQPAFIKYAQNNLVLVRLDFPRSTPQSDEVRAANEALAKQYEVRGYPTVILLKPDGTVLWKQVGFLPGGPEAMIAKINAANPNPKPTAPAATAAPAPGKASSPLIWTQPPPNSDGQPRLQAILYSAHPTVMLEGKNCEEGDSVNGMKVVKIARESVTVEWKGQIKELTLR